MSILYKRNLASVTMLAKGISRLSELWIDADKDWNTKAIHNLKSATGAVTKGDTLQRQDLITVISPTNHGDELTSSGPGQPVAFKAPPSFE
jgi:hypothetical protein